MRERPLPEFGRIEAHTGRGATSMIGKLSLVTIGGVPFIQVDCPCTKQECEYLPDFVRFDLVVSIEASSQLQAQNGKRNDAVDESLPDGLKDIIKKLLGKTDKA